MQEDLNKGLSTVGRAIPTKVTLPITQNILLVAEPSFLKLVATNLEITTIFWVSAKVVEEGSITVPAKLLIDFVSELPTKIIEFNLPPKKHILGAWVTSR